ncbi:Cytochrome P450 94A1 [Apostasia shenzhenica]|uniref:noroxomaritidine synthase n=1 Tax=Apostasia shenzhenica TaxID=1088818 RepID=A0A2I0AC97_9ASPA|nr:Cytochrome P450 94A1 [Apostasia shenzhenica]
MSFTHDKMPQIGRLFPLSSHYHRSLCSCKMDIRTAAAELVSLNSTTIIAFILSAAAYLLLLFFFYFSSDSSPKKPWIPPEVKPYPIIGHLPQFLRNRSRFLDWITDLLASSPTNTIFFTRGGGVRGIITANPANVEHILKLGFDNYPKGNRFRGNLRDFLGCGIFNSDGQIWRLQRKTASFEFNTRSLRSFVHRAVAHETSARLLPLLRRAAASGEALDLQDLLERFAFDNICKVAFDEDTACLDHSGGASDLVTGFASAFRDAAELSAGRFRYAVPALWKVKKLFNIGSERRLRESIATVHAFAMQIIRSRKKALRASATAGEDLLSRFISDDGNISDEFLRDIIISFILAGRDTTSSALTWFFWLLSSRPDVERRILAEIRSAGGDLGLDRLREMNYLHAALTESMRLYPPVAFNTAECQADEVLPDGTEIKKRWFMAYVTYAMGRMEGIWGKDCRDYRPERWLDSSGEFRPESPFRFPAFHAGTRMCLGKEMAYIQMKSIAACVIGGFEMEVLRDKDTCPPQLLSLTLRMSGGLPVRVRVRCTAVIE